MRERELKRGHAVGTQAGLVSLPMRERELKLRKESEMSKSVLVAPHAGA